MAPLSGLWLATRVLPQRILKWSLATLLAVTPFVFAGAAQAADEDGQEESAELPSSEPSDDAEEAPAPAPIKKAKSKAKKASKKKHKPKAASAASKSKKVKAKGKKDKKRPKVASKPKKKKKSKGHVETTYQRARDVVDLAGFKLIHDISPSPILSVLAAKRTGGSSISRSNHYLRATKMFTRWLVRDRRTSDDRLAHLATLNEDVDRRRVRRPLTMDELGVLLDKTQTHKQPRRRLKGPDRVMLYIIAVYTGLRRSEIASITPMSFAFDSDPPTVTVEAGYSKRRQKDVLPLRRDFAVRLQTWISANPKLKATSVLFPIKRVRTSEMLEADLNNARAKWIEDATSDEERSRREGSNFLKYYDDQGRVVDFHSLRKTFITNLTKSGVAPKTAQLLARHSDINLTMNTYTSLGVLDQAAAVEALPPVPTEEIKTEPAQVLRATGTDDQDQRPAGPKKVPVLVPRGAQMGAKQVASGTIRLAPDCTEKRINRGRRKRTVSCENPNKNGPIRARKGQSASSGIRIPEGGVEPPRPCGHWILSPACLPFHHSG